MITIERSVRESYRTIARTWRDLTKDQAMRWAERMICADAPEDASSFGFRVFVNEASDPEPDAFICKLTYQTGKVKAEEEERWYLVSFRMLPELPPNCPESICIPQGYKLAFQRGGADNDETGRD